MYVEGFLAIALLGLGVLALVWFAIRSISRENKKAQAARNRQEARRPSTKLAAPALPARPAAAATPVEPPDRATSAGGTAREQGCRLCGSTSTVRKHPRSRKVFFTWWLWAMEKKIYCENCGVQRVA